MGQGSSKGDEFQSETLKPGTENLKFAWMVRPCEWYKDEFSECTKFRARFHQLFIDGEVKDCSGWHHDFNYCIKYREKDDIESLTKVIESEQYRTRVRLGASKRNDIWTYRTSPPEDWNKPLPAWFLEQNKNTYLEIKQRERVTREEKAAQSADEK